MSTAKNSFIPYRITTSKNSDPVVTFDIEKEKRSLPPESGVGWINPPVPYRTIISCSAANGYHVRCIEIKSQCAVGAGIKAPKKTLDFLESISIEDTFTELMLKVAYDLMLFGNAFIEIEGQGSKLELYHVPAWTVYCKLDKSFIQTAAGQNINFDGINSESPSRLLHFKSYSFLSSFYGLPSWFAILEALRLDKNMKLFLSSFFDNHALPDFIIFLKGAEFSEKAEAAIKAALEGNKGVENAHKAMLLDAPFEDAEFKLEKLTPDIKSFELEKSYNANRDEIIGAHGVPPRLLGIVTSGQLGGGGEIQGQLDIFFKTTIIPIQNYIAARIRKYILIPAGMDADFEFLLPEIKAEETTAGSGTSAGSGSPSSSPDAPDDEAAQKSVEKSVEKAVHRAMRRSIEADLL